MHKIYRIIIAIILIFSLTNAIGILIVAVVRSIHAYSSLFSSEVESDRPGLKIFESVDGLLIVLLLVIMNIGFLKLFLPESKVSKIIDLPWLKINSFSQLKILLIETILTTLVIVFATLVVKREGKLEWPDILIPVSILFLGLTIKVVRHEEH